MCPWDPMQVTLSSGVLGRVTRTSSSLTSRPRAQSAECHSVITGRTMSQSGKLAITDTFELSQKVKKRETCSHSSGHSCYYPVSSAAEREYLVYVLLKQAQEREYLITVGEKKSIPRTNY